MNRACFLAKAAAALALCMGLPVQAGLYLSGDFGMNFGSSLDFRAASDDRPSVCDEYINPRYATVNQTAGYENINCTRPDRGHDSRWQNRFSSDDGPLFGLAVGYDMPDSMIRTEFEYFYRDTGYDEASDVIGTGGAVLAKLGGELEVATDSLGSFVSHNLFTNLYLDFDRSGRIIPYVGVGIGLGFTEVDYGAVFQRNPDPSAISTGDNLPNAAEIQANLAGTTSVVDDEQRETLFGYQLLAGLDYRLTGHLSAGLKLRWVRFEDFRHDSIDVDLVRSHPPYLRKSGADREKVGGKLRLADVELFGASLNLKYLF